MVCDRGAKRLLRRDSGSQLHASRYCQDLHHLRLVSIAVRDEELLTRVALALVLK